MKIKFEVETNSGKKLSLADLKKKAKDVVNVLKEDSNVQKAQEKVKGFVNTAADFADNAIEKVEDYIDQKLADEKDAGPDDITEEFFEEDDDEGDTGEDDNEGESEEPISGCIIIIGPPIEGPVKVSFEEFMNGIVNFEESDEKPDISIETECFLNEIEYFSSDVSKAAFKAVINLPKITYVSVINVIKEEFPEMSRNEIRELLKADFKNWVNVRQPELKEDCPNANCITLLKYWAKKFKEF